MNPLEIVGLPQVIIILKNDGNSVTSTGPGAGEKEVEMIILFHVYNENNYSSLTIFCQCNSNVTI